MIQARGYQGRRLERRRLAPHSASAQRFACAAPRSIGVVLLRGADPFGLTQALALPYGLYGPGGAVFGLLKAASPGSPKLTDVLRGRAARGGVRHCAMPIDPGRARGVGHAHVAAVVRHPLKALSVPHIGGRARPLTDVSRTGALPVESVVNEPALWASFDDGTVGESVHGAVGPESSG